MLRYVDDSLIGSSSPEEHLQVLRVIILVLSTHGSTLNAQKGIWGVRELDFLGCHISSEGIRLNHGLIRRFGDFNQPRNHQQLLGKELFGLCLQVINYQYCQHQILATLMSYKSAPPEYLDDQSFKIK